MKNPKYCDCGGTMIVLETRDYGDYIRRRRRCDCCGKRISTKEVCYDVSRNEKESRQDNNK